MLAAGIVQDTFAGEAGGGNDWMLLLLLLLLVLLPLRLESLPFLRHKLSLCNSYKANARFVSDL